MRIAFPSSCFFVICNNLHWLESKSQNQMRHNSTGNFYAVRVRVVALGLCEQLCYAGQRHCIFQNRVSNYRAFSDFLFSPPVTIPGTTHWKGCGKQETLCITQTLEQPRMSPSFCNNLFKKSEQLSHMHNCAQVCTKIFLDIMLLCALLC